MGFLPDEAPIERAEKRFGLAEAAGANEGASAEQRDLVRQHPVRLGIDPAQEREGIVPLADFDRAAGDRGKGVRIVAKDAGQRRSGGGVRLLRPAGGGKFGRKRQAGLHNVRFRQLCLQIADTPGPGLETREESGRVRPVQGRQDLDREIDEATEQRGHQQHPEPPVGPAGAENMDQQAELDQPAEFGEDRQRHPVVGDKVEESVHGTERERNEVWVLLAGRGTDRGFHRFTRIGGSKSMQFGAFSPHRKGAGAFRAGFRTTPATSSGPRVPAPVA